jgi:hypothetical protein
MHEQPNPTDDGPTVIPVLIESSSHFRAMALADMRRNAAALTKILDDSMAYQWRRGSVKAADPGRIEQRLDDMSVARGLLDQVGWR